MIEIKNLCKSFGTKQVLNNLNLAIKDNTDELYSQLVIQLKTQYPVSPTGAR